MRPRTYDYEIKVQREGRFSWRYMVVFEGNGYSGDYQRARTRWGAIRKARKDVAHKAAFLSQPPWEDVEFGLLPAPKPDAPSTVVDE